MKFFTKDFLEKVLSFSILLMGIYAIWSLLKDDSADIVSDEGRHVLDNDEKMKKVNEAIGELKSQSASITNQDSRVVVKFD